MVDIRICEMDELLSRAQIMTNGVFTEFQGELVTLIMFKMHVYQSCTHLPSETLVYIRGAK